MKKTAAKLHAWMEKNLEEPLLRAEMARAEASDKSGGAIGAGRCAAVAGLLIAFGLIVALVTK